VGAGIDPGGAAAEQFDRKLAPVQIDAVEVGDLQLATGTRLEVPGDADDIVVVEVEAGDREVRLGLRGLLLDVGDAAGVWSKATTP
jgi:hypothetical protein